MIKGKLTAQIGRLLSKKLEGRRLDVLFDHGRRETDPPENLGRIVSWFGEKYEPDALLAFLDIAIVQHSSEKVFWLIEIEESTDNPKVVLGDVLATLLGHRITFQGNRPLNVGPWTKLLVLCRSERLNQARIDFLKKSLNHLKSLISTSNASIGKIVIDTFADEFDLEGKLLRQIENALYE